MRDRQLVAASGPLLSSAQNAEDQGQDEQDDRNPEEKTRTFHRRTGSAAKAQDACDDCDNEKYQRPMKKIAEIHPTPLSLRLERSSKEAG